MPKPKCPVCGGTQFHAGFLESTTYPVKKLNDYPLDGLHHMVDVAKTRREVVSAALSYFACSSCGETWTELKYYCRDWNTKLAKKER